MVSKPLVVILLENLPIARDRRVWREATALRDVGIEVIAVCPRDRDGLARTTIDGIEIRTFVAPPERSGALGFVWEYAIAWVQMLRILRRIHAERHIDGLQACNPPDIFFPHGLLAKRWGARFVFDQHDLSPELFETRFGRRGLLYRLLVWSERATYRVADRVISTNDSYRRAALQRGSLNPDHVVVVRNGPDPETMTPGPPDPSLKAGRAFLVVWMGNMGPQDGVDEAVRSIAALVHGRGRTDCGFVFIGKGEVLDDLRDLARNLDVADYVTFTGWIPDEAAFTWLSTADVGLSADPPGPLNDKSTMNKTLEYMAFGLPVVAHDLVETRVSAGDAAVYAATGDPEGLAACLDELLGDPVRMAEMGQRGRERIDAGLSWPHQRDHYVELWSDLLGHEQPPADQRAVGQAPTATTDARTGHESETQLNTAAVAGSAVAARAAGNRLDHD